MFKQMLAAVCGFLVAAAAVHGQAGERVSLFNGNNLDGWRQLNGTATYAVQDGAIVGTTVAGSPNSFLCTEKDYGNFILELEFKVDEGLNSGVQIRSRSLPDYKNGRVHGYQVEIDPAQTAMYDKNPPNLKADGQVVPAGTEPRSWTGGIYDEARRGWLNDLTQNEVARKAFKPGEWNHLRIEAIGDSIRTWVNGVPAGSIVDSMTPNGFIGLQVHAVPGDEQMHVRWRNIRIQDMGTNSAVPDPVDAYIGDWTAEDGGCVAQVFRTVDGVYKANLLVAFDTDQTPLAVLTGTVAGDELPLEGEGWKGVIANRRFKAERDVESFTMRRSARLSPTLNAIPPEGAVILFNGTSMDAWVSQKPKEWLISDGPADWKIIPGGRLEAVPEAGPLITNQTYGDCKFHAEFRLLGDKTNSGIFIMSRYELNVNESYGIVDGSHCGSFTNLADPIQPRVPMTAPAWQWQTFDVDFRAPRFDDAGNITEKARATVYHNGVMIHDNVELGDRKGAAKRLGDAATGPLMLQEHGTALQFRNIWLVEK